MEMTLFITIIRPHAFLTCLMNIFINFFFIILDIRSRWIVEYELKVTELHLYSSKLKHRCWALEKQF